MARRRHRRRKALSTPGRRRSYNQAGSGRRERKNRPHERRARLEKIRGEACQARGCYLPRGTDGSYSGYCKLHHQRMKRWAQPNGRAVLKRELTANVGEVMAFLERYKNNKSIMAATGWIDRLLRWSAKGGRVNAREHWARLCKAGIKGEQIFATHVALFLFVRLNRDFDYGRPFRLQLGHCVGRLAKLPTARYWNSDKRRYITTSRQLTTGEREAIGEMLHNKFNRLIVQIVQHMDQAKLKSGASSARN